MTEKPYIVPIFLTRAGCRHHCAFCNAGKIAGGETADWTEKKFIAEVEKHLSRPHRKRTTRQIAFYGGNFTGIEETAQRRLLHYAKRYVDGGLVDSIRVSTRPDCIDRQAMKLLKAHGVATVEIGAQSMDDAVLEKSLRGHTSADVKEAVVRLTSEGFETGIHLMVGLPGESRAGFRKSVQAVVDLRPDTVRIHPTLVFEDTALAGMYRRGEYTPLSTEEAVDLCKYALARFAKAGIPVIRLGLQTTEVMAEAGSVLAGPYHPAFRSLVDSALFCDMALELASVASEGEKPGKMPLTFFMSPKDVSSFLGLRRTNLAKLRERYGREIAYGTDSLMPRGALAVKCGGKILERRIENLNG
ncbi:MAG TPA: radical SAM protein [Syntrophales bacterium]|nr:radical SAM protein [Syntrophales bacterium]HOX94656.1 radical SAM protein [Syntrophales bacterium]HPI56979.1 radical SAM protein [Syntrophales bacterium]HPN23891.1 radical SAM protein [Syntrophales bacterium]HQM29966.1 radical SAM protein [Syntrophales bacterium]